MINLVRWIRVTANSGFAFFSSLLGLLTFDSLVKTQLPFNMVITASLFIALINAGTAFFRELLQQSEFDDNKGEGITKDNFKINHIKSVRRVLRKRVLSIMNDFFMI